MLRIKIAPEALGLELEADLVATFNAYYLKREGAADIWLDILPQFVGPQDIAAPQANGLLACLEEFLLVLEELLPNARIEVDAKGSALIYTS